MDDKPEKTMVTGQIEDLGGKQVSNQDILTALQDLGARLNSRVDNLEQSMRQIVQETIAVEIDSEVAEWKKGGFGQEPTRIKDVP